MRLRIESVNGSPINDYRVKEGRVQVRVLDAAGHEYASPLGCWRVLDEEDIELHHALRTVVSEWLRKRLPAECSISAEAEWSVNSAQEMGCERRAA